MKYICMQQFDCFELYAGQVNHFLRRKHVNKTFMTLKNKEMTFKDTFYIGLDTP